MRLPDAQALLHSYRNNAHQIDASFPADGRSNPANGRRTQTDTINMAVGDSTSNTTVRRHLPQSMVGMDISTVVSTI
jgi:hypothetical protein